MITRKCKICGKQFHRTCLNKIYCSPKCAKAAKSKKDRQYYEARLAASKGRSLSLLNVPPKSDGPALRSANNYNTVGWLPNAEHTCFFCPFVGPQCRENHLPLCKPGSGRYQEFRAALQRREVYG